MPFVSTSTSDELPVAPIGDGFNLLYEHFKQSILTMYRERHTVTSVSADTVYSHIVSRHPHNLKSYMESTLLFTNIQIFHSLVEILYIVEDYMSNSILLFHLDTLERLTDDVVEQLYNDIMSEIISMYNENEIIYSDITSYCENDILQNNYRSAFNRIRSDTTV